MSKTESYYVLANQLNTKKYAEALVETNLKSNMNSANLYQYIYIFGNKRSVYNQTHYLSIITKPFSALSHSSGWGEYLRCQLARGQRSHQPSNQSFIYFAQGGRVTRCTLLMYAKALQKCCIRISPKIMKTMLLSRNKCADWQTY